MKRFGTMAGWLILAASLVAASAQAALVPLTLSDPTQLGRLSRNGVPQDFAGDEPFPGVFNPTTRYHFHAYSLEVGETPFIDIITDSLFTTTFVSVYQTSYHPNNLATNWLGDAGTSGEYFGTNSLFFDVSALINSTIVIVLNETTANAGIGQLPPSIQITGFTDTEFNGFTDLTASLQPFATVIPEPSTIALLAVPLLALGLTQRRRRTRATPLAA